MKETLRQKAPTIFAALVLIILLTGLDQWTKWAVVKTIPLHETVVVIPDFFELTYLQNRGAAFSSMEGVGMGFFTILTIIAIGAMVYFFLKTKDRGVKLSLALIMAGAIGNLIDRMMLGYVRDFFRFYIFGSPFAVFNVADVCISIGFVLLLLSMFHEEWMDHKAVKAAKAAETAPSDPKEATDWTKSDSSVTEQKNDTDQSDDPNHEDQKKKGEEA